MNVSTEQDSRLLTQEQTVAQVIANEKLERIVSERCEKTLKNILMFVAQENDMKYIAKYFKGVDLDCLTIYIEEGKFAYKSKTTAYSGPLDGHHLRALTQVAVARRDY